MPEVGQTVRQSYHVDAQLVHEFAQLVKDLNPLHLDAEAAKQSRFGRPIAHGTLIMSFVTGLLSQRLPGPGSVYLVQHSQFRAPVYVGDEVTVEVTVEQLFSSGVARIRHQAMVDDRVVLTGYSDVLLPEKAQKKD